MSAAESMARAKSFDRVPGKSAWTGWVSFASAMLLLIGCFQVMAGLVGIFKDDFYAVSKDDLVVSIDYTAWGVVHLLMGAIAIATAVGMGAGVMWARVLGVIFAITNATVNLAFISAYPVWSTLLIAFDVILIWALTVHGAELRDT